MDGTPPHPIRTVVDMTTTPQIDPPRVPAPSEDKKPPAGSFSFQMNRQHLVWVVVGAIAFDLGIRRPVSNGIGVALTLLAIAVVVGLSGLIRRTSGYALLAASAPFAMMLVVRADPRLSAFNLIAAVGLIIAAVAHQWEGSILNYRPGAAFGDALEGLLLLVVSPFVIISDVIRDRSKAPTRSGSGGLTRDLLIGSLLALPVLLGLGTLLASADPVFLALITALPVEAETGLDHMLLIAIGSVIIVTLLQLAGRTSPAFLPSVVSGDLTRRQVEIVLGSIGVLFGIFALAQGLAAAGAADGTLEAAGESYRNYARQGFFQLLWVAAITLALLLTLRILTAPPQRYSRSTIRLNALVIGLTILIAAVALVRLSLYVADDGQTPLRFYSLAFSVWVVVGLVISGLRLAGRWADYHWLSSALLASGLIFLLGLNIMNPEAIIANENMDDHPATIAGKVDRLSAEGRHVVANRIDELNTSQRIAVLTVLCESDQTRSNADWNLGAARLESSIRDLCD